MKLSFEELGTFVRRERRLRATAKAWLEGGPLKREAAPMAVSTAPAQQAPQSKQRTPLFVKTWGERIGQQRIVRILNSGTRRIENCKSLHIEGRKDH